MPAAPSFLQQRLLRLRDRLVSAQLDALVVSHLPNVYYLTGFTGTAADLVVTRDELCFVTDFRYVSAAEALLAEQAPLGASLERVEGSYDETIRRLLARIDARIVGIEAAHMSVKRYDWFTRALAPSGAGAEPVPRRLVPTERLVERLRARKDGFEIACFRRAARMLDEVVERAVEEIAPGRSEREIAWRVEHHLREAGFDRPAFPTIVASGPNSAFPHARPTARRLERGEVVVLDLGGIHDGYCVDLTRVACLGPPDARVKAMHEAVIAAQEAAIAAVSPGTPSWRIDAAARGVLDARGLAEAFGHGTGHGLGIEVHEEPAISRRRADTSGPGEEPIESGMVFTIEPGAYVPGVGGVRIEDDVLVTEHGAEVLTSAPRHLRIR